MSVYINREDNFSDMRGPCAEGFHIPTKDEWEGVIGITGGLGITYADFYVKLHLPKAGGISYNGTKASEGTACNYWICNCNSDTNVGYYLRLTSYVSVLTNGWKGYARSIRPFKDTFVKPTSTWTVIAGTLGSGGIFWNSTDGIISITGDGNTGYTIADKNLGATTVYSDGATLSEANCGKYYQRGNNYGFPFSGSITTSSTRVDASGYGPGNYYSSSTFITVSSSPYDWSSVQNDNLRGGATGAGGQFELKNAYIGEAPYEGNELCFISNTTNNSISLRKIGSPAAVSLETSLDGKTWTPYSIGSSITLRNVGDKVYFRSTSGTTTGFSTDASNHYKFVANNYISARGDITSLINKNFTKTLSGKSCFNRLFDGVTVMVTPPELPATTLTDYCYQNMFANCSNLESLPSLPATTLASNCYASMFLSCTKIKLSTTQTGEYQTPYRIPKEGTGTAGKMSLFYTFYATGGTFTGTPNINTTYYTSNAIV